MDFSHFNFAPELNKALAKSQYTTPTPIQVQAIPPILDQRDVIGCAQTGTGKTAAFALPVLHNLLASPTTAPRNAAQRGPQVLVVAPTRELAAQINDNILAYSVATKLRSAAVFGGVGMAKHIQALKQNPEVVIACPGRLLDLHSQGHVHLGAVEVLILDEADRMLDMGFLPAIRQIINLVPKQRQTLLFSATMAPDIRQLAQDYLVDPVSISVAPTTSTADTVSQAVYHVERSAKTRLLCQLIKNEPVEKVVVFTRTKHGADRLVRKLDRAKIRAAAIHGNKSQGQRMRAMDQFRDGTIGVLVASDLAARGLDVQGITHVVNFDLPQDSDTYIHRIGRCGRAGASGMAWTLCAPEERAQLRDLERGLKKSIPVADWSGSSAALAIEPAPTSKAGHKPAGQRSGPSKRRGGGGDRKAGDRSGQRSQNAKQGAGAARQDGKRRSAGSAGSAGDRQTTDGQRRHGGPQQRNSRRGGQHGAGGRGRSSGGGRRSDGQGG